MKIFLIINLQVYCSSHVPKSGPGHFDQTSVGIRQALNAPKSNKPVNEQIRGGSRDIDGKLNFNYTYNDDAAIWTKFINFQAFLFAEQSLIHDTCMLLLLLNKLFPLNFSFDFPRQAESLQHRKKKIKFHL